MAPVRLSQFLIRAFGESLFYRMGYYYLLTRTDFHTSIARIRKLENKHTGQRCFIIGNGPSLQRMDLSPLRDEITFGLNRIYLLFPTLGFPTSYYLAMNKLVVEQWAADILTSVPGTKFISYDARHWIDFTDQVVFLFSREGPRFFTDITRGIWQGATVTYAAMQVAYYLGFSQVILIGVDHYYSAAGVPHETVVSKGNDRDHFDDRYFGKGFRWQLPDLQLSELAYRLAKRSYEQVGREIVDATLDGKLTVFRKVDFIGLFD